MKKTRPPSSERKKPRRVASVTVTALIALLLLSNLFIIFHFSEADGVESGEMSAGVTRFLLEHFYPDYNDLSLAEQETLLGRFHKFVRKAAHFCEFALLGFLTTWLLLWVSRRFISMSPWKTWLFPAAFTLLYAISDEVHQIFTGRGSRVTDVLIDFSGALCGILLMQGVAVCIARLRAGKGKAIKSTRRIKTCETPATD